MGTVTRLPSRLERGPHLTGEAICTGCKHEWTAVAEVGTLQLECPSCGTMKGLFKHACEPVTAWTCNCGCFVFMISPQGVICYSCGVYQLGYEEFFV